MKCRYFQVLIAVCLAWATSAHAGPPFVTDDPEPVAYGHGEVYLASQMGRAAVGWSGTAPHLEVNYGVLPETQLHLIAPMAFNAPRHAPRQYGYGDTELGVKYRLVQETANCPQIGVFPLVELPTGDRQRGLGNGETQLFLPVWLQKSWGDERRLWTSYGGGGYWIAPRHGGDARGFIGWLLQRQVADRLTVGAEALHETSGNDGGPSDSALNAGGVFDLNANLHVLFSAGHTVQGPRNFIAYFALQFTFD